MAVPGARGPGPRGPLEGVLVVDKPSGPTSHDVVARARIALQERRIGHTGTLDPLATGVLPLVIGRATRLAQFLSSSSKTYDAAVRLGLVTDTYDVTGRVVEQQPVSADALDPAHVERALARFRGAHAQTPPPYSAKKIGGARSYDLARHAEAIALAPVPVFVEDLHLLRIECDTLHLRLTVSAGFYVRTLAHEVGAALHVGGCLSALRRIRSGDFHLDDAIPLDRLEREPQEAATRVIPLDALLPTVPTVRLTPAGGGRALHGAAIRPQDREPAHEPTGAGGPRLLRLLDRDGHLLALARSNGDTLHPFVVLG